MVQFLMNQSSDKMLNFNKLSAWFCPPVFIVKNNFDFSTLTLSTLVALQNRSDKYVAKLLPCSNAIISGQILNVTS